MGTHRCEGVGSARKARAGDMGTVGYDQLQAGRLMARKGVRPCEVAVLCKVGPKRFGAKKYVGHKAEAGPKQNRSIDTHLWIVITKQYHRNNVFLGYNFQGTAQPLELIEENDDITLFALESNHHHHWAKRRSKRCFGS